MFFVLSLPFGLGKELYGQVISLHAARAQMRCRAEGRPTSVESGASMELMHGVLHLGRSVTNAWRKKARERHKIASDSARGNDQSGAVGCVCARAWVQTGRCRSVERLHRYNKS